MAPRNAPLPNAKLIFHCQECKKGYSRQVDFETHLNSYDHTHNVRLVGAKQVQAAADTSRPLKGNGDMRNLPVEAPAKMGLGPRFTKIGGSSVNTSEAGSRFKKVGVTVSGGNNSKTTEAATNSTTTTTNATATAKSAKDTAPDEPITAEVNKEDATADVIQGRVLALNTVSEILEQKTQDADVALADAGEEEQYEEAINWEEYDVTKPTGCDHATCAGCQTATLKVDEDGWLVLEEWERHGVRL